MERDPSRSDNVAIHLDNDNPVYRNSEKALKYVVRLSILMILKRRQNRMHKNVTTFYILDNNIKKNNVFVIYREPKSID